MKKIFKTIIISSIFLIPLCSFGQQIEVEVDAFTNEKGYKVVGFMQEYNDTKTRSIIVLPSIGVGNQNLIISFDGIQSCNENNTLLIVFENGDKIEMRSFNKFNCKDVAYFSISKNNSKQLSTTPIKMMRFTNGRSHQNIDILNVENPDYFINLYKNISEMGL